MKPKARRIGPWIVRNLIFVSLVLATGADAQNLVKEIGGEYALGKNLTGDDCILRRVRPGNLGDKAERYLIQCEGWSQPSGRLIILRKSRGRNQPESWWLEESDWAQDLAEKY